MYQFTSNVLKYHTLRDAQHVMLYTTIRRSRRERVKFNGKKTVSPHSPPKHFEHPRYTLFLDVLVLFTYIGIPRRWGKKQKSLRRAKECNKIKLK